MRIALPHQPSPRCHGELDDAVRDDHDGVKLYLEIGAGAPVVFVHEPAADHRSWEMQMRHFGQRYPLRHLRRARLSAVRGAGEATLQMTCHRRRISSTRPMSSAGPASPSDRARSSACRCRLWRER